MASYQLKLAVGQLTVEGIDLPVQSFDKVAYYEPTARVCSVSPNDQVVCQRLPLRATARGLSRRPK